MRIVEYLHTIEGGHLAYTAELVAGLREAGADVRLLTGRGAAPGEGVLAEVPTPDTSLRAGTPAWFLDRVRVYMQQAGAIEASLARLGGAEEQWLHCQQLPTLLPSRFVRRVQRLGWKVCVTVHNVTPHSSGFADVRTHRSMQKAWRQADVLVVHSESLRLRLLETLGAEYATRVAVVAHPVWAGEKPVDAEPTRDFLFFGHLRPNKGAESFLQAMAEIPDATATVAGSGSPERVAQLTAEIERLGLSNVTLRGEFIPDEVVPGLFADHRVVVAPYREFEAQSGVTHLAVAYDRPIVVTDVGALRDLVDEFALGEVVESGEDLAERMRQASERAAGGLYREGLRNARESLSPRVVGERLMALLERHGGAS